VAQVRRLEGSHSRNAASTGALGYPGNIFWKHERKMLMPKTPNAS
jgi:hypothetical protein